MNKIEKVNKIKESRLYDRLPLGAHSRENYRFIFSATIIATFFIIPAENVLDIFLKWVLGFAMFFAATYLVFTAASIKYRDPRWMYGVLYISERVRMKTYDIAVDCFAVGLLLFISLLVVGIGLDVTNIELGEEALWVATAVVMLVLALVVGVVSYRFRRYDINRSQDINRLI